MAGGRKELWKIEQLGRRTGDSIFFSLLLLRKLSQEEFLPEFLAEKDFGQTEHQLLELVLTKRKSTYRESVADALTLLKDSFPFVQMLIEKNEKQDVEEDSLRELTEWLWDIPENVLSTADIFEFYFCRKSSAGSITSASGDFYTPRSVARCLAALLNPEQGTAYDPCCGSGALLSAAWQYSGRNLKLYGQTQDEDSYLLSQLSLLFRGGYADLGREPASTLLQDRHRDRKFDFVIMNPPFNYKDWFNDFAIAGDERWCLGFPPRSNANFAWLQHVLSHLKPEGRGAVVLPNGTLTTRIQREADIREAMIRNNLVEAIITLPPGLFYSTRVPCCIWLLAGTGRAEREILFIDVARMKPAVRKEITSTHIEELKGLADRHRKGNLHGCTEWYGTASPEAVAQKEFLLSPNLYLAVSRPGRSQVRRECEKLAEIIEEISAQCADASFVSALVPWKNAEGAKAWKKADLLEIYDVSGGVMKGRAFFGRGTPLVDVKAVIHAPYVPDHVSSCVEVTEDEKIKYGIKCGDVLLNRTSETTEELACGCVALKDQEAVCGGFLKRLRPRGEKTMDPLYAACYFRSEIYRWEVENVSTVYTTYASINNKKLSKIAVYFPDTEMQKKLGSAVFSLFRFREQCTDERLKSLLEECERLLIRRYITCSVMGIQSRKEDDPCR